MQLGSIQELSQTTEIAPTEVAREMLGQVNQDRALSDLHQLTREEPICASSGCYTITNRLTASEGLDWATDYICKEPVSLGYAVEFRIRKSP